MTDLMKIKNSWIRNQTAKAIKKVRHSCADQDCCAHPEEHPLWQKALFLAFILGVCLFGGCFLGKEAHADEIPTENAILAIIGEAENQGYTGMLAVACALRNRATLSGVYGFKAPRVRAHKYSQDTYKQAQKAWYASFHMDITNGATHWENIKAFGCPSWVKRCVETFRYKDHVFYKEVRA